MMFAPEASHRHCFLQTLHRLSRLIGEMGPVDSSIWIRVGTVLGTWGYPLCNGSSPRRRRKPATTKRDCRGDDAI